MQWPLSDAGLVQQGGAVAGTSLLTTVTASATAHVKGAWTELIASASFNATMLIVRIDGGVSGSVVDSSTLLDVGFGAAGSEIAAIPDVPLGGYETNHRAAWHFPISVPSGTRIAARLQSAVVSKVITLQVVLTGGGMHGPEGYSRATNYGANTANSSGVQLGAPTSVNTKPTTFTEIVASTANPMRAALLCIAMSPATVVVGSSGLLDVAIGATSSETVLIPDVFYRLTGSESCIYIPLTVPMNVPAGSRLSARYQSTSTSADARPAVVIIGFD